ncbi:hypothetical protein LMJ53_14410 [Rheinheimera sp. UJ51]|uniref:hypothetical protein n=1 Tax=Rheinheimera sp. UJ51 TaxID=2892446 RepID=UPI001E5D2B9C|nr:hypothetical protein [Rheinheimera sp. UJ51]MCC5452917.1 hypothetical protein [Rheinheimera sp. UJ51]
MTMTTISIIIVFFAFCMAIGMTLLATYYAALYKEEQRKNRALELMQCKTKKEKKIAKE